MRVRAPGGKSQHQRSCLCRDRLFAGMRRAESERLGLERPRFESELIEVTAEDRQHRRRFATVQPNLREWVISSRRHSGNVAPRENFRGLFEDAREAAGMAE